MMMITFEVTQIHHDNKSNRLASADEQHRSFQPSTDSLNYTTHATYLNTDMDRNAGRSGNKSGGR
jgi:hypothetical protein